MPDVVRFMLTSFAIGVALGWTLAAALLWFDAFGLGGLIRDSDAAWIVAAMVLVVVGGTFGVCFTATGLEFLAAAGPGGDALADPEPWRHDALAVAVRRRTGPRSPRPSSR